MKKEVENKRIAIIGAGPAGLSAAYLLAKDGHQVMVFESDPDYVGGLSRTICYNGFRFDIGGHRFFSKDKQIECFWHDILGSDLIERKRLSRIYYKKKFLAYPIKPLDIILKLSPFETIHAMASYLWVRLFPPKNQSSFEGWVRAKFGNKLFLSFFKTYTEKVWGMSCQEISSDWAKQRINNLNFLSLVKDLFSSAFGISKNQNQPKSLIDCFHYPRLGPGMLWERVQDLLIDCGGEVLMGQRVESIFYDSIKDTWSLITETKRYDDYDELINTSPLPIFLNNLNPPIPEALQREIDQFKYRGFITVTIMFKGEDKSSEFKDNWLYIHGESVRVARIQNYKNWSPEMVPSEDHCCYGMEYFCTPGDDLWAKSDEQLFKIAKSELEALQLYFCSEELDFKVIRTPRAYPIYDLEYEQRLNKIRSYLDSFNSLHTIGRNGLYRYNNQDHSIKTGMLIRENINLGVKKYDPWMVNQDAEYIESKD